MPRKTPPAPSAAAAHYDRVVAALCAEPGVSLGAGRRRGFGAGALATGGRIFAMLTPRGRFVVKLPRHRVDALVAGGSGARFEPAPGRVMKEWFEAGSEDTAAWLELAREARRFVAS